MRKKPPSIVRRLQSRRQNQRLKHKASRITQLESPKRRCVTVTSTPTSQNGVRAILRVQGNTLPPTAKVIKIKLASTSATITYLMKDFRDKGRNPRFNRSAPKSPQPARPSPPTPTPPPPREYRVAPNRVAADDREIVYGVEPIRELVASAPASIRVLYVKSGNERRFSAEIDLVRTGGGRVEFADDAGLERVAGLTARHQGIAALMREYEYASLESILAEKPDPIVLVDGVTDPRNLGALMRSAEGAGGSAIV